MPSFAVVASVLLAALLAWAGARMLVRVSRRRSGALDDTWGGLRKVHAARTPRVGGIALALGIVGGSVAAWLLGDHVSGAWLLLLGCAAPAFVWGLIEDVTKRGAVLPRLVLPALGAALGFVLLDARIAQLDLPLVDQLLRVHAFAFLVTLVAVTGVTHAMNVIDGLNGLATVSALIAAVGLAIVAAIVNDALIFSVACVLVGALAGFFLVNYPSGRIFLGDGGAYLVGLLVAELSVLLVQRNSEVSPWFPLLLVIYPVWETLFSMYRRRSRGRGASHADALHLHQLVYRRVVRWRGFRAHAADQAMRNSLASLYLWVLPAACLIVALAFWQDSLALQLWALGFVGAYMLVYRALVLFRVPRALVIRAPGDEALLMDPDLSDKNV